MLRDCLRNALAIIVLSGIVMKVSFCDILIIEKRCDAGLLQRAVQNAEDLKPIPLDRFGSSAHHWRDLRDASRFVQARPDQPAYAPNQVREIVANILLFQRDNGGWPKDYDMTAVLTADQKKEVLATRSRSDTSYDNDNIHSQVDYLARAIAQVDEPAWRLACERGFDFLLASQYPHGGFPQRFPNPKDFHAHITFNDGVMIGILNVLEDAADGAAHFRWLDEGRRQKAREAVRRGVDCILKCQIREGEALTGWCQQHDEMTFEPRPARTFELASLCPQDTAGIVRFLIRSRQPSPAVLASVEGALVWLNRVKLLGVRVEKVKAPREEFLRHSADFDVTLVADPKARPLWARHYEIGSNRPVFAGRDGIKRYALAEIERERRTGTAWYGSWPLKLIETEYPQWRRQVEGKSPSL
ncbi:pectate lyase [Singulisphaera acidiphila]|uniref:Pectate lyase, PelA/Pel-15E family n=1 Tax=Singulisphaera acidiphila (strain ATCC BAA-1392 / DSM 18658 / VKM B-2454 / MOB10) TaxID=886293 RepID=L0D7R7_SINAD|nr:pectate lyase [Singulisphaera acidiphila]AGA24701.1 pectate lyase, PelA/Pel-15E family [Singulisphaera acidiphila DSM 18658]